MGNKLLRPDPTDPFAPFNDDQKSYLHDKFESLCEDIDENDKNKTLRISVQKIKQELQTTLEVAEKILRYIDFEEKGQVDFYEFMCAAASLHQDDEQAQQFLFDLFKSKDDEKIYEDSFKDFFKTVLNYLHFMELIKEPYNEKIGQDKFKQYDYNHNQSLELDEFRSLLQNDYHCALWMQILGFAQEKEIQRKQKPVNQNVVDDDQFAVADEQGDEAGCCPSWIPVAKSMCGSNGPKRTTPPSQKLEIGYVYGYRSYDTRSNLKYNSQGNVVYHTAGCGIILNKLKNTQLINTQHNDDITCLDINVKKNLVATGEMGKNPIIAVWDALTAKTIHVFTHKQLIRSIAAVAISPSGKYVAAVSMCDDHDIFVFDITSKSLVAFGKGPKNVVFHIKFNAEEDTVILACDKQVAFANFSKGQLTCKKGVFGKAPVTQCYSVAVGKNGDCLISQQNGLLTLWKGNSCTKVFKEHTKTVYAVCQRQNGGFISGDTEGNIIVWSQGMTVEKKIDLKKIAKSNNARVISLYELYGKILVGTRGGQIIEINKGNGEVLIQGHFDGELWGLAVNSTKNQFYTGGQDKLLLKWDMTKRKCMDRKKLDNAISCMDFSKNTNLLAVGMKNGVVNVFQGSSLKQIDSFSKHKNPDKDMISVVKFSPDGTKLAIAYAPPISKIYFYDVNTKKDVGKPCTGSPSRMTSIDFNRSGDMIHVNSTGYEILFWSTKGGSREGHSKFKGDDMATLTSRFSWATLGIWPACSDGSDINSVDRSNSKQYLVTGDDFSKVKIFDFPATQEKQINTSYKGHSSHVTCVKWSFDDRYIISTGGLQKSIIQWTCIKEEQINYNDVQIPEQKKQQEMIVDPDEKYQFPEEEIKQSPKKKEKKASDDDDEFEVEDDSGDQALAVKPFEGQVKASTPKQFQVAVKKNIEPIQSLAIKHVWGVRNSFLLDRVRNQVRYSNDYKSCAFITAALGVEMNLKTKQQTFYQGHAEDLITFDITSDGKYCATGQMAQINKGQPKAKIVDVHVWNTETKKKQAVLSKFHQRAVVLVKFSPSGQKLLTVGQDDKNSLAVYDWKNSRKIMDSAVDGARVLDAAWKDQNQFITCGMKHIKFWGKGTMGKIAGNGKWDPMLSAVCWDGRFVTGGMSGNIYLWNGNTGTPSKVHNKRIDCLAVDKNNNLYSGDAQGRIISWKISNGKLAMDKEIFNASTIDDIDPGILSIDFSPDKRMLICTNSSSIYEISGGDSEVIMSSHCAGELWGEAWSPNGKQFVTGGDDKTLRVFDTKTYKEKYRIKMKDKVRGVDWQPHQGNLIIAGDYRGKIHLFNTKLQLQGKQVRTIFAKTKPRKQSYWIQDIKFSPNGENVAFGAHGGASHIQVYKIQGDKIVQKQTKIAPVFTSALLSIDWSKDSSYIAAVSQAYELQFTTLTSVAKASAVANVQWASWSSKFGYQVKQIHQDVDYSNINCVCVNRSKTLVVSGGDDQKLRLFTYPVNVPKQKNKQFIGHSSHVTKVRFSPDQSLLLSIGGNDRTIILWQVKGSKKVVKQVQEEPEQEEEPEEQSQAGDSQDKEEDKKEEDGGKSKKFLDDEEQIVIPQARQPKKPVVQKKQQSDDEFQVEDDEGDEFMAVKPWKGAIKPPDAPQKKSTGKAPNAKLQLQYAYGYRTKDCRNNLKYVNEDTIVYHTAGLGVLMDRQSDNHEQKFFDGHSDDIISFYQAKNNRNLIFTSQMGANPLVIAWNESGQKVKQFKGAKKGVSAVLGNQKHVIAACLDDDHYVYAWDFKTNKSKSEKGGRDTIVAMEWVNDKQFVSVGLKHFKVWNIDTLKGKTGAFGKNSNLLLCVGVKDSSIYCGASDGSLQVWRGTTCEQSKKIHGQSAVHSLWIGQNTLMTGGGDKCINILSLEKLQVITTIKCEQIIKDSINLSIRALDVWEDKILVGTLGSEIYELKASDSIEEIGKGSKVSLGQRLMTGHYAPNKVTNELWGLALYEGSQIITCSDDATLRLWDIKKRTQINTISLLFDKTSLSGKNQKTKGTPKTPKQIPDSAKGRCLCVNEDGWIVVGCKDGTLKVLDNQFNPRYCELMNKNKKEISHVKFSPDGRLLAVGDHLGFIYIFEWKGEKGVMTKKKHAKPIKHGSAILHFDFSKDSNSLHSTCRSYELLFWQTQTGKQITGGATSLKNQDWATWNITIGWPVQGIFESFMDGTDLNAIDRSNDEKGSRILVTGDDHGKVRLLEYPCTIQKSQSVKGKGHSSHVTNVKFTLGSKTIISTGGEDQTILQWKCTKQK